MRKFILIAAMAVASATSAQAGDSRSLSVAGIDEKVPAALGKAAGAPKIVEAPKPPDLPKPPEARAAETAKPVETAKPAEEPAPQFVARPALGKKPSRARQNSNKDGQVTFEEKKPVAAKEAPAVEAKPVSQARSSRTSPSRRPPKPRSRAANDAALERSADHARIYRYGAIAALVRPRC